MDISHKPYDEITIRLLIHVDFEVIYILLVESFRRYCTVHEISSFKEKKWEENNEGRERGELSGLKEVNA